MFGKNNLAIGILFLLRYLECSPFKNKVGPSHTGPDPRVDVDVAEGEGESWFGGLYGKSPM